MTAAAALRTQAETLRAQAASLEAIADTLDRPRWLSIVDYAIEFGVSEMTVRRMIKDGELDAQMVRGQWRIKAVAS